MLISVKLVGQKAAQDDGTASSEVMTELALLKFTGKNEWWTDWWLVNQLLNIINTYIITSFMRWLAWLFLSSSQASIQQALTTTTITTTITLFVYYAEQILSWVSVPWGQPEIVLYCNIWGLQTTTLHTYHLKAWLQRLWEDERLC